MKEYKVYRARKALKRLLAIQEYVFNRTRNQNLARAYILRVDRYCDTLSLAPHRGRDRSDLRAGIRVAKAPRTTTDIVFAVDEPLAQVHVLDFWHAGFSGEFDQAGEEGTEHFAWNAPRFADA